MNECIDRAAFSDVCNMSNLAPIDIYSMLFN